MASGYSDLSEIRKDGQFYGLHQKPPKINLLNEKPRRDSQDEQHLTSRIERPIFHQQQQMVELDRLANDNNYTDQMHGSQPLATGASTQSWTTADTYVVGPNDNRANVGSSQSVWQTTQTQRHYASNQGGPSNSSIGYSELVNDLARKEAKLRKELAYMNQHLANPWARPPQVRDPRKEPQARPSRNQQRWFKEYPTVYSGGSTSRPTSRASSTRSTTEADLLEKADQLMKDVDELEKKPLKTQQVLIESGATKQQVSWPDNSANVTAQQGSSKGIHAAIIKVPANEPDNKSPLPFAFDNFSTLGIRGNIASVGAAEPDSPYPPIYPIVKRTPSPRR